MKFKVGQKVKYVGPTEKDYITKHKTYVILDTQNPDYVSLKNNMNFGWRVGWKYIRRLYKYSNEEEIDESLSLCGN